MYVVKKYLTDETVAIVTRKEDAVAMIRNTPPNEDRLIIEEKKIKKN
jgi:hypothetical protein